MINIIMYVVDGYFNVMYVYVNIYFYTKTIMAFDKEF